jgi:hypothetical protein
MSDGASPAREFFNPKNYNLGRGASQLGENLGSIRVQ